MGKFSLLIKITSTMEIKECILINFLTLNTSLSNYLSINISAILYISIVKSISNYFLPINLCVKYSQYYIILTYNISPSYDNSAPIFKYISYVHNINVPIYFFKYISNVHNINAPIYIHPSISIELPKYCL